MRCRFVEQEKANYPIELLCRMMRFSPKTFHARRTRAPSARTLADAELVEHIRRVFADSRETYGSPRVHAALVAEGVKVGRHRVARLMRREGLRVRPRRPFRCRTTVRNPAHAVAPNELAREFEAAEPGQKWVGDVSYVPTGEGWLYTATVLDLYNREVIGWAMSETNDQHLTAQALRMAILEQRPSPGLIFHSDRGSTYTAGAYRDLLAEHAIVCSMSAKGDCWDNAVAESFFATLKKELVDRCRFATRAEARAAIFEYIEMFYNRKRLHSTLGFASPVEFRKANATPAPIN